MKVLLTGADGLVGRHIAFALRIAGHEVLASARRTDALQAMGFQTLRADLADVAAQDPAFWMPHLKGRHLVHAAGLLTGTEAAFQAVHQDAPKAMLAALDRDCRAVLISAVGIAADTRFARWRRSTEALFAAQTILRPGLVLAETSYGGSSLIRALAALPVVTPVVGSGLQPFNPLHAEDLALVVMMCLAHPPGPGAWEIGGPQTITQTDLIRGYRRWLGLADRPVLRLPLALARALGRVGDVLDLGPISATAVAQLQSGVVADPGPLLAKIASRPRGIGQILGTRPAGTQDLWQARLYLIKPLIRFILAGLWLFSAALGAFAPLATFLPSVPALPPLLALALTRLGGLADLALAVALLTNWRPQTTAYAQLALVAAYTLGLTLIAPALWLDPFGGVMKNLPILALILVHLTLIKER